MCFAAPYEDTESTAGAATCTVTSVDIDDHEDREWEADHRTHIEKLMQKKACLADCPFCNRRGMVMKNSFLASEQRDLQSEDRYICKFCYRVSHCAFSLYMLSAFF